MLEGNGVCQALCSTWLRSTTAEFIQDRIKEDYSMNWVVDGLPVAQLEEVRDW
jgi:transmembrane 9 superfamily member 2/4